MGVNIDQLSKSPPILRNMGIRGFISTIYNSLRHTHSPVSIICGKRARVNISPKAEVDIGDVFLFGAMPRKIGNSAVSGSYLYLKEGASLVTRGTTRIGSGSEFDIWGDFSIGDSYISGHTRILCRDSIEIGDGCAISWNVDILDSDSHYFVVDGNRQTPRGPVTIEDDVWIGQGSTITKNVTIGEGAVIGANSVVSRDIPPNSLAVGSPAEVIRKDVEWE